MKKWSVSVSWQVQGGPYPSSASLSVVAASAKEAIEEARKAFHFQVAISELSFVSKVPEGE